MSFVIILMMVISVVCLLAVFFVINVPQGEQSIDNVIGSEFKSRGIIQSFEHYILMIIIAVIIVSAIKYIVG